MRWGCLPCYSSYLPFSFSKTEVALAVFQSSGTIPSCHHSTSTEDGESSKIPKNQKALSRQRPWTSCLSTPQLFTDMSNLSQKKKTMALLKSFYFVLLMLKVFSSSMSLSLESVKRQSKSHISQLIRALACLDLDAYIEAHISAQSGIGVSISEGAICSVEPCSFFWPVLWSVFLSVLLAASVCMWPLLQRADQHFEHLR